MRGFRSANEAMLQFDSWNSTAQLHNSCSPENATVTVKSALDNKVASQEFNWRLVGMNPPHPHSLSVGNFNLLTPPPKSTLFLWRLVFGGGRCVSWEGCGNGYQRGDGCLEEVQLRKKEKRQFGLQLVNHWHKATLGTLSPTLQPMASSVCRTTMVATVATATTLVSSWTTGQKVSTNTEPEIRMAITISVQCNHSKGMIQNTCRGKRPQMRAFDIRN